MPIARRTALLSGINLLAGAGIATLVAGFGRAGAASKPAAGQFEFTLTDDQWKARLSPQAYAVLRHEATETPFSSPLNSEHRKGTFSCAGCALALFSSDTKFDSGTGWPSFFRPLPGAVAKQSDTTLGMVRDEVHCRRCGGHLGHVFDDGPAPTGQRYCMNSVALKLEPGEKK